MTIRHLALAAVDKNARNPYAAIQDGGYTPNEANVVISVLKTEKLIHKTPSGWLLTSAGRRQLEGMNG